MPRPQRLDVRRSARMTDYWWVAYRRTWKGSVISSFVVPLLYVLAMGVLLGGFIEGDPAKLEGASSYLAFVVPGLLASQSMTRVFGEVTYPVMSRIKWDRSYYGMIATPLSVSDVVFAHLAYVVSFVALTSAVFLGVTAAFGVFHTVSGVLLAFLAQLLIAAAFAAPVYAFTARLRDESGFALVFRLGMIPMFLFSGAFFPVANLDPWMETLAKATPLWHGVDLTRMLLVDRVDVPLMLVHIAYLGALTLTGWFFATRLLHRRLVD